MGRRIAALIAVLSLGILGLPATGASAVADVPAYGLITISDSAFGLQWSWTYGPDVTCQFSSNGPAGVASVATVTCDASQSLVSLACPQMDVTRTTDTVVGARASCDSTLDMGVGTTGAASANLGHVYSTIVCEAYVDQGVLVPPFSVTCDEPGLPSVSTSSLDPVG